ncbi:methyltransferase [Shewanella sp. Isolate8]|uniref:tRNA1(Val) (adenine(37)-N6)-methyltransferase n=1 Tax=Shewanella sp. Isolate8 TaxID=2908529 RepID=UPI001EFE349F|nr:methyltransferase [Shewanella sp. Isolate8]MCG9747618.1 methyltransferase [Shewanella sp. Isolate8]
MPFTFKQFHVDDSHCGMPVSTDGVLLGAWAPLAQAKTILDIGAGSGLLSLMAAQRSEAMIQALEIDRLAAQDCQHNIDQSPWRDRITLTQTDLLDWYPLAQTQTQTQTQAQFDHILCNPPYFDNGPQAQCDKRAQARHTDSLAFEDLLRAIKHLLAPKGQASLILPAASLDRFLSLLPQCELALHARVDITTTPTKAPQRHLLCLSHDAPSTEVKTESLSIRTASGEYSEAMVALTQAFYLKL